MSLISTFFFTNWSESKIFKVWYKPYLKPCLKIILLAESATGGVLQKMLFLEILQNSQENTSAS